MNRTELINFLIEQRNYSRYLEISLKQEHQNFAQINCNYKFKLEVDSTDLITTFPDFSLQKNTEFDIILIDGIHTEEQVITDIRNAERHLTKNGVIVLHDCMPPDAWHQRDLAAYREGENWNGTVWKAALRIFNSTEYKCYLLDTDWGCGIIDTAQNQTPLRRTLPETLDYEFHYFWLLEYKTSVAAYLRAQVKVFYHLACMGNWQSVLKEQMTTLQQSGFTSLNLSVLGTANDLEYVNMTCKELQLEYNIHFHAPDFTHFEKPAMLAIQAYAKSHKGYVFYLHSKGVSNPADETKVKWRRLMMHELVEKWEQCVLQLPYFEVVGVNWRDQVPTSHFCGNFWYASTRYLRTLTDFEYYYEHPQYQIWDAINSKRLGCEFWISSAPKMPRLLSLAYRNVDFCNKAFWQVSLIS